MDTIECTVVGAGVIGLAIAESLSTKLQVCVLEKEGQFGTQTSSRHSEVIHAGIYYPKGSLKAKLCVEGKQRLYRFCEHHGIPHQRIGKLIVATNDEDVASLDAIHERARDNYVNDLQYWDKKTVNENEPNVNAVAALFSPSTGIIDSHCYMQQLDNLLSIRGGMISYKSDVTNIRRDGNYFIITMMNDGEPYEFRSHYLINAAGLMAQNLARHIDGLERDTIPTLYPCKGHYFGYQGKSPFNHLIYPVPPKNIKGLGIHATLNLSKQVRFGPDAHYINSIDYRFEENLKSTFMAAITRYFPDVVEGRLHEDYTGIRPKIQGPTDSVKDFVIQSSKDHGINRLINLFGIESPGLTSSLAIADYVRLQLEL